MADRRVKYEPLTEVLAAPRNPKLHDQAGLRTSIGRFGMGELPLIDERTGRLVAGHGRIDQLNAMRSAGEEPPDGVTKDKKSGEWLVPVVRGWASRSDAEAEAYLLASNKLVANGGWDSGALSEMLEELANTDFDLAVAAGWGEADLEALLAAADPVLLHEDVPATDAAYAETPEQEAARGDRVAAQTPRYAAGLTEMILIYTEDDRAEVGRLINAARDVLGAELRASDIVQRALRTLVAVLDARDDPRPISMAELARYCGMESEPVA